MVIDQLTARGVMEATALYDAPFSVVAVDVVLSTSPLFDKGELVRYVRFRERLAELKGQEGRRTHE